MLYCVTSAMVFVSNISRPGLTCHRQTLPVKMSDVTRSQMKCCFVVRIEMHINIQSIPIPHWSAGRPFHQRIANIVSNPAVLTCRLGHELYGASIAHNHSNNGLYHPGFVAILSIASDRVYTSAGSMTKMMHDVRLMTNMAWLQISISLRP